MRVLLCAWLVIALLVRGVAADGAGVIAASAADRGPVAAAMVGAMAGRAERITGDAVAEARAAVAAGAVPIETMARFRRVRALIDEGWSAYLRVPGGRGAPARQRAHRAEALVALPGGAELYADAALRLGAVLGHLGRGAESRAVLALALALDPERPITLAEFSPDVVAMVDQARAAPAAKQRLRVVTAPVGAVVSIDGQELGRAPIDLELTRGQHVLVARAPGHRPAVQGVLIGEPSTLELALDPDEAASRLAAGAILGLSERAQQELAMRRSVRGPRRDRAGRRDLAARRSDVLVQRCAGIRRGQRGGRRRVRRSHAASPPRRRGLAGRPHRRAPYPPGVPASGAGRSRRALPAVPQSVVWTGVGAALVVGTVLTIVAVSGAAPPPTVGIDPSQYTTPRALSR